MKKNLAIVIPLLTGGGAERVVSNLSLYLSDDKYRKYIIINDDEIIEYPYKGKLISLKSKAISNIFGKIFNIIKRVFKLKIIKKKYKINTTISFLSGANIINILSKKNDKVVVSVRNFVSKSSNDFYGKILRFSIKLFYNKADIIVVVSKAIKNDLVNNYALEEKKIRVIYNLYDIEKIQSLSQEKVEDGYTHIFSNPTIITVGRLSKQKGQWHLIRAFKKVKDEIPDAKLVILGQGELEDYLKQLTVDLGLEKDVFFLGFQKNPFKYIAKSTIYVFPSLYEGFPNALCEAMACGTPVISSDCKSGPREILAPDTDVNKEARGIEYEKYGILVPVCDGKMYKYNDELTYQERILSGSIIELLVNTDLLEKYSLRAIKRVNDFRKENIIKIWEQLI